MEWWQILLVAYLAGMVVAFVFALALCKVSARADERIEEMRRQSNG